MDLYPIMGPCASSSNSRYRAIPPDMPLRYYPGYRSFPSICHYGTILCTGHLLRFAYYGTMLGTAQAKLGSTQLIS